MFRFEEKKNVYVGCEWSFVTDKCLFASDKLLFVADTVKEKEAKRK